MTKSSDQTETANACECLCVAAATRAELMVSLAAGRPRGGLRAYRAVAAALVDGAAEISALANGLAALACNAEAPAANSKRRPRR